MISTNPLKQAIRQISPAQMTEADAEEAARNIAGLFSLLIEIDRERISTAPTTGMGAQ